MSAIDITSLVRKNVLEMKPYSSARDEFKGEADVYLDANENPYPSDYNRYPDPLQWEVKEKLAKLKGVNKENILLGNGSDEPIDLLIRAFCEPNIDSILITEPTYGMYSVCAAVNAVTIQKVLLNNEYDLDLQQIKKACNQKTRIIFLCSPNNPTGNSLSSDKVITILNTFNGIVVVDEAYIDFTEKESFVKQLDNYPNLVILQTFSKAWGLAGLRLGICFASEEIIGYLNKIKYPYNINSITQKVALQALENYEQKNKWVEEIIAERARLTNALKELKIVEEVYPSDANFLLVKFRNSTAVFSHLIVKKIIVRDRSRVVLCENSIRITVGTPKENERLINELKFYEESTLY